MTENNPPETVSDDDLTPLAKRFLWVENPQSLKTVITALGVLCAVLFVIDLFYHRHAYFSWEQTSAFYAITGFVAFTLIVLAAAQLRRLIKRDENYYGDRSVNSEPYPDQGLAKSLYQPNSPARRQTPGVDEHSALEKNSAGSDKSL